jgi:NAD(P)-dependent dehydrogenase (short-subunit alcohol dehydrogenase family)
MPVATDVSSSTTFWMQEPRMTNPFDLSGRVAIVTGGAGFMGPKHGEYIAAQGGVPVLVDLPAAEPENRARQLSAELGRRVLGFAADITKADEVRAALDFVMQSCGRIDILINNAANNPKVDAKGLAQTNRFEDFSMDLWNADLEVVLTGSFLCCQIIGGAMARQKRGVILNVASDLAVISPDQRLYRKEGLPDEQQPVKPVTYSVAKTGLIGLTRYLATYWADAGVRVNAISPGGVENNQAPDFVRRLEQLIPMGRMAHTDEWQGAVVFLCSDASSYITGTNLVIDGGRSLW